MFNVLLLEKKNISRERRLLHSQNSGVFRGLETSRITVYFSLSIRFKMHDGKANICDIHSDKVSSFYLNHLCSNNYDSSLKTASIKTLGSFSHYAFLLEITLITLKQSAHYSLFKCEKTPE